MSGPSVNSNLFGLKQNFLDMGMCQKNVIHVSPKSFYSVPKNLDQRRNLEFSIPNAFTLLLKSKRGFARSLVDTDWRYFQLM